MNRHSVKGDAAKGLGVTDADLAKGPLPLTPHKTGESYYQVIGGNAKRAAMLLTQSGYMKWVQDKRLTHEDFKEVYR